MESAFVWAIWEAVYSTLTCSYATLDSAGNDCTGDNNNVDGDDDDDGDYTW